MQLIPADLLTHALQAAQHWQLGNRLQRDAALKCCFRQRDKANEEHEHRDSGKLAETSSQERLLRQLAETFGLPRVPRRIEVYDNSHIQGSNAVGAMVVAGPEGFRKKEYRKFNIRSADLTPGDDFAMMREVLSRRFKRLLAEAPLPSLVAGEVGPVQPDREGRRPGKSAPAGIPLPQGERELQAEF